MQKKLLWLASQKMEYINVPQFATHETYIIWKFIRNRITYQKIVSRKFAEVLIFLSQMWHSLKKIFELYINSKNSIWYILYSAIVSQCFYTILQHNLVLTLVFILNYSKLILEFVAIKTWTRPNLIFLAYFNIFHKKIN